MSEKRVLLGCLALAALSLALPSVPSYDPWAWLNWGREIAFLELDTRNGPSWKPLPVVFTTVFAPFGKVDDGIPPALWLVTARAGALIALYYAYKVAGRLAGPNRRVMVGAGVVAALALALSPSWLRYMAHGNEAPMAVALMLAAVDRHLDGSRRAAVVLGFLACLLRPEVFPFLALYGAMVWWREPAARRLIAGLAVALPVLWLVPEWIGSGDPLGAARQARSEPAWSLSLQDQPWLALLERWHGLAGLPLQVGALLGLAFAWRRRERVSLTLGALAVGWVALIVAMTQAGFSGNARYLLAPLVVLILLASAGAARAVAAASERGAPAGALAATALALLAAPFLGDRAGGFADQAEAVGPLARLHHQLEDAVDRAGGPDEVMRHGAPTVNRKFDTHLAWELKVPIRYVELGEGEGVVFTAEGRLSGTPPRRAAKPGTLRPLARAGSVYISAPATP